MKAGLERTLEKHSGSVHELQFVSVAQECYGGPFHELDTNTVRQRAFHGCFFDPWNRFDLLAAGIERHAQDALPKIGRKDISDCGAADKLISGDLHLIGAGELDT